MGVTEPTKPQANWSTARGVLIGGLIVYVLLAVVFLGLGFFRVVTWEVVRDVLLIAATVGTAIGTVGLAAYTFQLASVTRQSVAGAEVQLREVKGQGASLAKQAEAMSAQAEASRTLAANSANSAEAAAATAEAAAASSTSAERARIDAIAPLVSLGVSYNSGFVGVDESNPMTMHGDETWRVHEVPVMRVEVHLKFEFKNVGKSPASLAFGGHAGRLYNVARERLSPLLLMPGEVFEDEFVQRFDGQETVDGVLLEVAITYDGLLHGEMFDHINWKGWVIPLKVDGNTLRVNKGNIVNAAPAQVIRTYPNLERPDEMAEARERIMGSGS